MLTQAHNLLKWKNVLNDKAYKVLLDEVKKLNDKGIICKSAEMEFIVKFSCIKKCSK